VWVIFQLWYASPLPFALRFAVFNDTEARSIHLAIRDVSRVPCIPGKQALTAQYVPILDLGLRLCGRIRGGVSLSVLQRAGDAAWRADAVRCDRRRHRRFAFARSDPARSRPADGSARRHLSGVRAGGAYLP
jgi:hypothetical protein